MSQNQNIDKKILKQWDKGIWEKYISDYKDIRAKISTPSFLYLKMRRLVRQFYRADKPLCR